jgi:hypothetical protein
MTSDTFRSDAEAQLDPIRLLSPWLEEAYKASPIDPLIDAVIDAAERAEYLSQSLRRLAVELRGQRR